jgi:hypothetical protein
MRRTPGNAVQKIFETHVPGSLRAPYGVDDYRASARTPAIRSCDMPDNDEFVTLLDANRDFGGIARAQEVASMTMSRCGPDVKTLAAWILDRQLLSFEWQSQIWIPLFQFDRSSMALHPGLGMILSMLTPAYAPWEQALWFTQANAMLGDRIPAHVLPLDHPAVLRAARESPHIAAA